MRKENSNYNSKFVEKSTIKHNNKYDYSLIPQKFTYNTWVYIICPVHGTFTQRACAHAQGSGCQQCAADSHEIKQYSKVRHTKEQFIHKAQRTHGMRYDYSNSVYLGQMKLITIECADHGEFTCIANNHVHGTGCPSCKRSRGETKIELWLRNHNFEFETQKTFSGLVMNSSKELRYDFYIPSINLLIEFDGKQHYEPVSFHGVNLVEATRLHELTKQSDELKNRYSVDHNINLLRISYKQIRDIPIILDQIINISVDL